jgi:hypothetical protein
MASGAPMGAPTSSAIPRDGEGGLGFRIEKRKFEREALKPTWPEAHRAGHFLLRAARRYVTNVKGVELQ